MIRFKCDKQVPIGSLDGSSFSLKNSTNVEYESTNFFQCESFHSICFRHVHIHYIKIMLCNFIITCWKLWVCLPINLMSQLFLFNRMSHMAGLQHQLITYYKKTIKKLTILILKWRI